MISVPPESSGEKVGQNWLWDLEGLVRDVQEIDRVYLCVCVTGGGGGGGGGWGGGGGGGGGGRCTLAETSWIVS